MENETRLTGRPGIKLISALSRKVDHPAICLNVPKTCYTATALKGWEMTVELKKISQADKHIVKNMFQFYLYDMSENAQWGISDDGDYKFDQDIIEAYFREAEHYPYFITHEGKIAGFALVRQYPYDARLMDMGQFFVLRKHKRKGIGQKAFELSLKKHPGLWQVRILPDNHAAQCFWKNTVSKLSGGKYENRTADYQGIDMTFLSFSSSPTLKHIEQ